MKISALSVSLSLVGMVNIIVKLVRLTLLKLGFALNAAANLRSFKPVVPRAIFAMAIATSLSLNRE
ncbi:hypothetical protein BCV39_08485 [Vibrio sp. 10N.286.55.E10]|nr:hypothetical protein BCV39_08485 [Vibrio sp. 10N.286.55.E10]PME38723.1 hypothetical protein BCV40_00730 [Vibrio sp. 10N.286.55.E12]PME61186.1 hypothetical protein BCV32_05925 [Vibrio sp. 10N.286.55.C11]